MTDTLDIMAAVDAPAEQKRELWFYPVNVELAGAVPVDDGGTKIAEEVWLPKVGPTAWLLLEWACWSFRFSDRTRVYADSLATRLGVAEPQLHKAIARLVRFNLMHESDEDEWLVAHEVMFSGRQPKIA